MLSIQLNRLLSVVLAGFVMTLQVQPVNAEIVTTEQAASLQKANADREKVKTFANRADVQDKLQTLGVSPESSKARVDALTDTEVASIAGRIDSIPAGGTLSQTDLLLVLLIAILVAIVL